MITLKTLIDIILEVIEQIFVANVFGIKITHHGSYLEYEISEISLYALVFTVKKRREYLGSFGPEVLLQIN